MTMLSGQKTCALNWPRPSIGTTAKAKGRRRSAGAALLVSATTMTLPALRSDDGTVLNCVARARAWALLLLRWR